MTLEPDLAWWEAFDPENFLPDFLCCPHPSERSEFDTQGWLNRNAGAIKSYVDPDTRRTAAQLIDEASARRGVSRRLLIATLQREQSLIDPRSPNAQTLPALALDRACGQAVFDARPGLSEQQTRYLHELHVRYRGFANQLDGAAKTYIKHYLAWREGFTVSPVNYDSATKKGEIRTPKNAGSYACLQYTPHDKLPNEASQATRSILKKILRLA